MRPRAVRASLAWVLAGMVCGCATQRAMREARVDLQRIDLRLVLLGERLAAVDSLLQLQQADLREQRLEQTAADEQMQSQVVQLQARVDESARRLGELREEIELLRVYGVGKAPPRSSEAAAGERGPADRPVLVGDAQSLYDMAMADMKAGNYQLAASEFGQFVESFPESELADNALYWQGECYYADRKYGEAATCFAEVEKRYPQGDKVPAALLKLGFARLALKDNKQGTKHLNDVIRRFPDTPEAAQARAKLKTIGRRR